MTHLAEQWPERTFDRRQVEASLGRTSKRFQHVPRHVLNSAPVPRASTNGFHPLNGKRAPRFSHIRVGLAMYGVGPGSETMGLETRAVAGNLCPARAHPRQWGSGYGFTDAVDRAGPAVLSVGYADGYPRSLGSSRGRVLWRPMPQRGR